jgi:hypothetical protein
VLGGPFTGPEISDARWIRLIVRPEPDADAFALDLLDAPYSPAASGNACPTERLGELRDAGVCVKRDLL